MGQDQNPSWPLVNPIPRDPSLEWHVGTTFAPFTADEWIQLAAWNPMYRIQSDQAPTVTTQAGASFLLVARCLDDASITELIPYLHRAWAIELGNEPTNDQWDSLNGWYKRMIPIIRNTTWGGIIITAGIANLNSDTLNKAATSIDGLWPDIVFGWHGYDNWVPQIPSLLGMLNGRRHAMTESGYPQPDLATEQQVADTVRQRIQLVKGAGSLMYIHYQTHDDQPGKPLNDFGLFTLDGRLRPVAQVLQEAA